MKDLGINQLTFAEMIDQHPAYISAVLRGRRNKHDLDDWAAALGVRFVVVAEEITLREVVDAAADAARARLLAAKRAEIDAREASQRATAAQRNRPRKARS